MRRSSYTIQRAKTRLSHLIEEARAGKEVVITRGRGRKPVAKIVPLGTVRKRRRPGSFAGKITADPIAFEPMSIEEARSWGIEQYRSSR